MSTENTPVDTTDVNLDDFAADFYGQKAVAPEPASPEVEEEEAEVEVDANEEDIEDDTLADEDEDTEDGVEEADGLDPKPEPKKNRFQERIDELVAKEKAAERKAQELEDKLNRLLDEKQNDEPKPVPKQVVSDTDEPQPDALNEDGTEKYPLGEFDPRYIKDLTKHALSSEREALKVQEQQEQMQKEDDRQKAELDTKWQEKLAPAQERYPDFQEKGQQLVDTFSGINAAYGEYLSATLKNMEYGPDVLYYLANNPDEATKIVNSGPNMATVALGRLEGKFADADGEKQKARPKVSKAPTPPSRVNKGSSVSKSTVSDDTDDLDAFSAKLFKSRGR
jgi:hypothetical protein